MFTTDVALAGFMFMFMLCLLPCMFLEVLRFPWVLEYPSESLTLLVVIFGLSDLMITDVFSIYT